jgi:hypothetical protein
LFVPTNFWRHPPFIFLISARIQLLVPLNPLERHVCFWCSGTNLQTNRGETLWARFEKVHACLNEELLCENRRFLLPVSSRVHTHHCPRKQLLLQEMSVASSAFGLISWKTLMHFFT